MEKSAKNGFSTAQYTLGVYYERGIYVEKNPQKAVAWYTVAADQGNSMAQYNLACCYYNGDGVKKDRVLAMAWYCCAWTYGDERAKSVVGRLMAELSDDEKSKAVDTANKLMGVYKKLATSL